jgi:hypothetical protein
MSASPSASTPAGGAEAAGAATKPDTGRVDTLPQRVDFGGATDFMLKQAMNYLKGVPVIAAATPPVPSPATTKTQ